MADLNFNYLLESSLCLLFFMAVYKWLIAGLTHFAWMRFYLLTSLMLSLVLPLIAVPLPWELRLIPAGTLPGKITLLAPGTGLAAVSSHLHVVAPEPGISWLLIFLYTAFVIYAAGAIYRTYLLGRNLASIYRLIKRSPIIKEKNYRVVEVKGDVPAFSFFHYIFINEEYKRLSSRELQTIKDHERLHAKYRHTFDLLFAELAGILFWFHPSMSYLKRVLREVHEFSVDEKIAGQGESKKAYAQLLLDLATESCSFGPATLFSAKPVTRRIIMLAKPRSSSVYKFVFLVLLPLTAILLVSFSCVNDPGRKLQSWTAKPADKDSWAFQWRLQKYCGVYLPSENCTFLDPLTIQRMDDKLFLVLKTSDKDHAYFRYRKTDPKPADRVIELDPESGTIYSYGYNNVQKIEFVLNDQNESTGCLFTQREGLNFATYEFSKQK